MPEESKLSKIIKGEYLLLLILVVTSVFIALLVLKQRGLYKELSGKINEETESGAGAEPVQIPAGNIRDQNISANASMQNESSAENGGLEISSLTPSVYNEGQAQMLAVRTSMDSECIYADNRLYENPKNFETKMKEQYGYRHLSGLSLNPGRHYLYYIQCFSGKLSSKAEVGFSVGAGSMEEADAGSTEKVGTGMVFGMIALLVLAVDLVLITLHIYKKSFAKKSENPQKPSGLQWRQNRYSAPPGFPKQAYLGRKHAENAAQKNISKKIQSVPKESYISLSEAQKRIADIEVMKIAEEQKRKTQLSHDRLIEKLRRIAGKK